MAITINGSGTVSGISAGGLPDGIIQSADLASGVGGKILQVQHTMVTSVSSFTVSARNTLYPITAIDTAITSTVANSKFVMSGQVYSELNGDDAEWGYVVGRLVSGTETYFARGDASGNRHRYTRVMDVGYRDSDMSSTASCSTIPCLVDSPNVSAGTTLTYRINLNSSGGTPSWTFYLNQSVDDYANVWYTDRGVSYITVMEIAP